VTALDSGAVAVADHDGCADRADEALASLRTHPLGAGACIAGVVEAEPESLVLLQTAFGGSRVVDMLVGDPLPRIC